MTDDTTTEVTDEATSSSQVETSNEATTDTDNTTSTQGDSNEIQKLKEALARATADYQNLIKRSQAERSEMAEYFTENFAKKILPTLDNLDRVVSGTPAELQNGAVYE